MARKRAVNKEPKRQIPRRIPPITTSRAFGQKSPLVDADIQAFLARCMSIETWNTYNDVERKKILESIPKSRNILSLPSASKNEEDGRTYLTALPAQLTSASGASEKLEHCESIPYPPMVSSELAKDQYIRRATARFSRDLREGYYEKSWQDRARRSHEERLDGKFDEYVKQRAEDMFENDSGTDDANDKDELALESEDGEYSIKVQRKGIRNGQKMRTN